MLASQTDPFDPMEQAIRAFADAALPADIRPRGGWTFVREYPLSPRLLAVTRVWAPAEHASYVVATKGAPEAIADLCHLAAADRAQLMARVTDMVADGLRVLGVARARHVAPDLPARPEEFAFELIGLIGLADPIRPE